MATPPWTGQLEGNTTRPSAWQYSRRRCVESASLSLCVRARVCKIGERPKNVQKTFGRAGEAVEKSSLPQSSSFRIMSDTSCATRHTNCRVSPTARTCRSCRVPLKLAAAWHSCVRCRVSGGCPGFLAQSARADAGHAVVPERRKQHATTLLSSRQALT